LAEMANLHKDHGIRTKVTKAFFEEFSNEEKE